MLEGMTHEVWSRLPMNERKKMADRSSLEPQLLGLEGMYVEVVDKYDEKRRFYVGVSTGWRPIHLEIKRINSTGGLGVMGTPFKSVRVIAGKRRY